MPINTTLAGLSQTPSSNGPDGTVDAPSTIDDAIRNALSFTAMLRDNVGFTAGAKAALGANSDITSLSAVTAINGGFLYGNRVINGAQEIDQVNSGAAVTPLAVVAPLTDMFFASLSAASKLTFQQVADAPAGLKNSMKVTVAAQFAPAATDSFGLLIGIEGKDVIDFQLGLAGAATITTSKWIKGSVAGTYAVSHRNSASNRSYVGTITVTTSWAPVKITLTGDVAGTWLTDTGVGLSLWVDLGSGTNFNTTAGAWQAGNFLRTSGSVTFVNQTAGSTLNITGVDCRLGSTAPTVFERRMNELQLCQRYFQRFVARGSGGAQSTTAGFFHVPLLVSMRVAPTVAGIGNFIVDDYYLTTSTTASFSSATTTTEGLVVSLNGFSPTQPVPPRPLQIPNANAGVLTCSARLF